MNADLAASALIVFGLLRLHAITSSLTLIGQDRVPKVQELVQVSDQMNLIARESRNTLIWTAPDRIAAAVQAVHGARANMDTQLQKLEPTIHLPQGVALLREVNQRRAVFLPLEDRFLTLVTEGQREAAAELLTQEMRPAQLAFMEALDQLKRFQIDLIDQAVKEGEASFRLTTQLTVGLLVLMIVGSAILSITITASVVKPVRQAVGTAERIAAGDLTEQIVITGRDEVSRLLQGMGDMQQSLRTLVQQVRQASTPCRTPVPRSRRAIWISPRAPSARRAICRKRPPPWSSWWGRSTRPPRPQPKRSVSPHRPRKPRPRATRW